MEVETGFPFSGRGSCSCSRSRDLCLGRPVSHESGSPGSPEVTSSPTWERKGSLPGSTLNDRGGGVTLSPPGPSVGVGWVCVQGRVHPRDRPTEC